MRPEAAQQRLRAREEYVATRAVEWKPIAPLKVNHASELHVGRLLAAGGFGQRRAPRDPWEYAGMDPSFTTMHASPKFRARTTQVRSVIVGECCR